MIKTLASASQLSVNLAEMQESKIWFLLPGLLPLLDNSWAPCKAYVYEKPPSAIRWRDPLPSVHPWRLYSVHHVLEVTHIYSTEP